MFDDLRAVVLKPAHRKLLKDTRQAMKLDQKEVATAARIGQSAYSQIETGTTNPKYCVLERACLKLCLRLKVEQTVSMTPIDPNAPKRPVGRPRKEAPKNV